jgi:hypothetical protein
LGFLEVRRRQETDACSHVEKLINFTVAEALSFSSASFEARFLHWFFEVALKLQEHCKE